MPAPSQPDVHLPWRLVRLDNGLTLLMHPDSTLPEVGVELWIRGGSREEAPGQFGVAHLFEHNLPSSGRFLGNLQNRVRRSQMLRDRGAGVEPDFIRFYEAVRPEGLALAIGALADRLESDSARFTAETLQRDQDVVISELRRSMGVDWNTEVRAHLHRGTFGTDHPYGHSVGGSETDVRAATVELMLDWHRRFAGASNAVVLIAGDFDPARAEAMVRHHFGPIRPGQPAPRTSKGIPPARALKEIVQEDVPHGVVYLRWPVAGWGSAAGDYLALLARVLERRVQQRTIGTTPLDSAYAGVELWEMAGAFTLAGTFTKAVAADSVEAVLRAELDALLREGPPATELARAQARLQAEFVRNLQRPAWRGGRTDVLGLGLLFRGNPDHYRTRLARIAGATPEEVRQAGQRWLGEPGYALHVLPQGVWTAAGTVDRRATVQVPEPKPATFPVVQDTTLSNGLRVLTVERPQLPLVQLTLAFEAGTTTDDPAYAGRARVALNALPRTLVVPDGTTLADALTALGAELDTHLDDHFAALSLSVLSDQVEPAIRLLAVALTREIPEPVLREATQDVMRRLDAAMADPMQARERALACLLSADTRCNPGAIDGLGTRAGLEGLSRETLQRFYAGYYHPGNAVLVASGDVDREQLEELLDSALAEWTPRARPEIRNDCPFRPGGRSGGVAIVDHPSATQSHILLSQRLPAHVASDPLLARLLTWALRTRLMANLRQDKGWSYEVYPFGVDVRHRGALLRFNIPVQTDKTGEAIAEIKAEIRRLREEPVAEEFLAGMKSIVESNEVTGALTSLEQMNTQLLEIARNDLPSDYYAESLRRLPAFTPEDLRKAARTLLHPDQLVWVIAGDRAAVESELREAGIRAVEVFHADEVP